MIFTSGTEISASNNSQYFFPKFPHACISIQEPASRTAIVLFFSRPLRMLLHGKAGLRCSLPGSCPPASRGPTGRRPISSSSPASPFPSRRSFQASCAWVSFFRFLSYLCIQPGCFEGCMRRGGPESASIANCQDFTSESYCTGLTCRTGLWAWTTCAVWPSIVHGAGASGWFSCAASWSAQAGEGWECWHVFVQQW